MGKNKLYLGMLAGIIGAMMFCSTVVAGTASEFVGTWTDGNTWTEFTDLGSAGHDEDGDSPDGGQNYDHEDFFYIYDSSAKTLSLGIQSGFDLSDGSQRGWKLGDLALSFDTDGADVNTGIGYEHAVDFGHYTENDSGTPIDADNNGDGYDVAGLYENVDWDNDTAQTYHDGDELAAPFAMDEGDIVDGAVSFMDTGYDAGEDSWWSIVTFDVTDLLLPDGTLNVYAHISMECGNDVMNGNFNIPGGPSEIPVPEPSTVALLGIGLAGLAGATARRRMRKKKEEQ